MTTRVLCWPIVGAITLAAACAADTRTPLGTGVSGATPVQTSPPPSGTPTTSGDGASLTGEGNMSGMSPSAPTLDDAGVPAPNPEAFWEDDPPPMYCGPSNAPAPQVPGGTPECPDDKNREGCPCDTPGETAPCWPGLRANRNRGQCRDGMTTCNPVFEFHNAWGACEGYVLPSEGVATGAGACGCFSRGTWAIHNLSPCIVTDTASGAVVGITSTHKDASCPASASGAMPTHTGAWSDSTLTVDCAGQFNLCLTLKAGDVNAPSTADCLVAEVCTDAWYPEADVEMALGELPGWTAMDATCAQRFIDQGGYAEMSVLGESVECDAVDDGAGGRHVFNRAGYCPLHCSTDPSAAECQACAQGGSGSF